MKGKEEYMRVLEEQLKHLRDLMKERDKALKLQRKETDRRLANLNGEHENIKQNQAKSVLREIYKSEQDEQDKKIEGLLNWKSNTEGRQAVAKWIAIGALIISVISMIQTFFRK